MIIFILHKITSTKYFYIITISGEINYQLLCVDKNVYIDVYINMNMGI